MLRYVPSLRLRGRRTGRDLWFDPAACRQADEGGSPSAIPGAAIFGIILTIRSNMLQNEAVTCYFEGKHCIQRIAALRYFRYSDSKELAITIFVSSALLLPALLHRTDNTPPPSCQSGSKSPAHLLPRRAFFFSRKSLFPQVEIDQLPIRATPVLPLSRVHLIVLAPARSSSKHIGLPLFQLWNFWQRRLASIHHWPVSLGLT